MYLTNAQSFYAYLKSNVQSCVVSPLDPNGLDVVIRFCFAKAPKTVFGKMRLVKTFVKGLIKVGVIVPVKVRFKPFTRGVASMFDSGKIVFYKEFLFSQPYHESVLTTLHESAHALLLGKDCYLDLKTCDVEFLSKYLTQPSQTVVCPIEYYANLTAISWLNQALQTNDQTQRSIALKQSIGQLQAKLEFAKEKI